MLWRNCAFCEGRHRRKMLGWLAIKCGPREASAKDELLEMTKKSSAWPKQLEAVAYRFAKARMLSGVIWSYGKTAVKGGASTIKTLIWVLPAIAIFFIALQSLFEDVVTLEPISVPKIFSENGFTPEVASRHLRDALNNFVDKANSKMPDRNVALHGELPTIIVPGVGLSLDTILSSARRLFPYGNSQTIFGEFILRGGLYGSVCESTVDKHMRVKSELILTMLMNCSRNQPLRSLSKYGLISLHSLFITTATRQKA